MRRSGIVRVPVGLLLAIVAVAVALAGCARFPEADSRNWHPPATNDNLVSPPKVPGPNDTPPPDDGPPPQPPPGGPPKPNGCDDPDPLVVATCLDPVSTVAVLPDGQSALVGERATGRILQVAKDQKPQLVATVPVDAAGGGLIGLVLSPTYADDQLLYAYIATPGDHRLVRIAHGQPPVPILTGIPTTPGSTAGALVVDAKGALLVATGGAGELGGKLLRVDTFGHPMPDNPDPHSPVYSRGLASPGGLCVSPDSGVAWVTDQLADRDVLYEVTPGQLGSPAWNWPDRPGVAGCVAMTGNIAVAETKNSALFVLQTMGSTDKFTGTPTTSLKGTYGHLAAASLGPGRMVWLGTVNKGGTGPVVSSDDRVIRLPLVPGGSGNGGPD